MIQYPTTAMEDDTPSSFVTSPRQVQTQDRTSAQIRLSAYGIETPIFSMRGYCTWGRVVQVHDGDTVSIVLPLQDSEKAVFRFSARLMGIDTCEIVSADDTLRDRATKAQQRLVELVTGGTAPSGLRTRELRHFLQASVCLVWVECNNMDKYGRMLVTLRADSDPASPSFADCLIEEHLAYPYNGGTKLTTAAQLDLYSGIEKIVPEKKETFSTPL